jgi:hypothetical protein
MAVDDAGQAHPALGDASDDARVGGGREAESAPFRVDQGAEQAELAHVLDKLGRIDVVVLERGRDRLDLLVEPATDRLQDRIVHRPLGGWRAHSFGSARQ